MKRSLTLLTLLVAFPLAAIARSDDGGSEAFFETELKSSFAVADQDRDGKLTRDEAKAGMPPVYAQFDEIDTENRGYVTVDQIRTGVRNAPPPPSPFM